MAPMPISADAVRALVARLTARASWIKWASDREMLTEAATALTNLVDENAKLWSVRARGCSCICHDDLDALRADLTASQEHVKELNDTISAMVLPAAELFQSGGKYADALLMSDSCVVDGLAWLDRELTHAREAVATLTAERDEAQMLTESYRVALADINVVWQELDALREVVARKARALANIDMSARRGISDSRDSRAYLLQRLHDIVRVCRDAGVPESSVLREASQEPTA